MAHRDIPSTAVEANREAYVRIRDGGHTDYAKDAERYDNFYFGDQWDEETKAKLGERPALTFNHILSTVNSALGEQISQRADIIFKPRRLSTEASADALTKMVRQINYANGFRWIETEVMQDGLIEERGYYDIRMDYTDQQRGEIRISSRIPRGIMLSTEANGYDPDTWPEVVDTDWFSVDEIEALYGKKKADEVLDRIGAEEWGDWHDWVRFGDKNKMSAIREMSREDIRRFVRQVRIIDRQYKKLTMVSYFVDGFTGDMRECPDNWDDEKQAFYAQKYDMLKVRKLAWKIRWTVTAASVVELHDDWSPYETFTIVPFFPYFRRGRPFGMVRNLIDPQSYLNKLSSQELHAINGTANSGWVAEAGSLVNMSETDLEERGAETGLVLIYRRGTQPPEKIKPNAMPSGLDAFSEKARGMIGTISGVNDAVRGDIRGDIAGVVVDKKEARGLNQLQVVFDNLARTRHLVAKKELELVQRFYSEPQVLKILDPRRLRGQQEEVPVNMPQPDGTVVNDLTLGEYDIVINSSPTWDNAQEGQFAQALQLREAGVQVPDHWVVQYSNLEDRDEISDEVRQLLGLQQPSEEEIQIQNELQQLQNQLLQGQVQELGAKVEKLLADANLANAKAQSESDGLDFEQQKFGVEIREGQETRHQQIVQQVMDLANKVQLANIHAGNKVKDTLLSHAGKMDQETLKGAIAERLAAKQPKPTAKS